MSDEVQISAFISEATKDLLERHTRATGVKKGHVVEMALLHHLRALQELPADVIVPARLVVRREVGERLLARIERPGSPSKALRKLMSGD